MSMDKAIKSGKEHRKPYRGAKAIDPYCRNHGRCEYCVENRLYSTKKRIESCNDRLSEERVASDDP